MSRDVVIDSETRLGAYAMTFSHVPAAILMDGDMRDKRGELLGMEVMNILVIFLESV